MPVVVWSVPRTMVSPLIDTDLALPTGWVSVACWLQVPPARTNTNTGPPAVPMAAVSPLTATSKPKLLTPAAVSLACCVQVPPERTNT